jgi:putative ABC transporter-associated repeat protein
MELYLNDIDGPQRLLSSTDESLRAIVEHVGAHTHANWVFDAPGIYTLTFVAQAERVGGGTARSQPQTYTFRVGAAEAVPSPSVTSPAPEPSATATPTPTPNTSPTPTTTPSPSPSQTTTPDASPVPTGTQTPGPAAAAEQAVPECIPTPVTTTVRPDNVDVVDAGHFDFGPVLDGGTLHALVKDDRAAPASWVDPGTLVFHLGDAAAADAPGGQFAFLGSGRIWQIPLTQQAGVPWLGWNTQHPSIAGHAQGQVTLTLEGLDGPGDLAVYSVDSWGQLGEKYFGTVGGFPRSTSIDVGASGVHVHGIWAFTAPGAYHADLTFAGTIDGERVSATTTLTFFAGAGDPRSAVRERTVTTYVGRTADGEECDTALAATGFADPETAADLSGLAGVLVLVGLAFVGAAALAPRTRERRERPAS